LLQESYYIVSLGGVAVGSQSFNVPNMRAIIDTGTSLIVGPTTWVKQILSALPAKPNCNDTSSYPDLVFTFNGV
jgi:hypothetical protein